MIDRVVLIHPSPLRFSGFLSTFQLPGLVTTHVGLTILAQLLARKGIRVTIYDEQITRVTPRLLAGADLVGISLQTSWAPRGYQIAEIARHLGAAVVLGGVHASLNPDEALRHADYVVRGEGEQTLPALIQALDTGAPLHAIPGLSYRRQGEAHHNPPRPPLSMAELDALPWPRPELIEGLSSWRFPLNRAIYFTMATRGCDQACSYCSITRVFGRTLRHRSVQSLIDELGARFDPRRQFLFFLDDSLGVDRDFLKELLVALLRHRLVPRLGWHSQLRIDVADDPELLDLMQRTNCALVTCGLESIDGRSLRALRKGQSPRQIVRGIARLRQHQIMVNGFFVFGTDHDGPSAMAETVRFARRSGCALAGFMPLTPFPGTPLYEALEAEQRILTRDWELYDVQHVVFRPRRISPWQLYAGTMGCYPAFYRGALWRNARHGRPMPIIALAAGAAWPALKLLSWSRELLANLDYLRALCALPRRPGATLALPADPAVDADKAATCWSPPCPWAGVP